MFPGSKLMKRITSVLVVLALAALVTQAPAVFSYVHAAGPDAMIEGSGAYSADWRTTGPTGGDVRALVIDPNDPDRFYFGTLDGQIYTSADGGKHWQLLYNFGKPRMFVDNIVTISP